MHLVGEGFLQDAVDLHLQRPVHQTDHLRGGRILQGLADKPGGQGAHREEGDGDREIKDAQHKEEADSKAEG